MNLKELYESWLHKATFDPDLFEELESIKGDDDEIFDRFYKELEFGTAGLRGIIGAGTNRMNVYTVGKATQGFANYLNSAFENPKVAIAYDSRIKSDLFSKTAASVFAANGIKVMIYPELMPTPMLSFAVRELKCDAGIVLTASHNPSKYNGYKAYGPDGCQLGLEASELVYGYMREVNTFNGIKRIDFDLALSQGKIEFISEDVIESFLSNVEELSVNPEVLKHSDLKVIYTPLNGTGNKPVRAIIKRMGLKNVAVVPEQEYPDGNFPTAPYPNPEIREAFNCALKLAENSDADLLLATDPDADRVGIAVKTEGGYELLTGNQVGVLLLDYILAGKKENGTLPEDPLAVTTIVSTTICEKIAEKYGCKMEICLTGFKFIGGIVTELQKTNEDSRYVFGFEESYGYMPGRYVRDKDAVGASLLICEMAAYYKNKGLTLCEVLNSIYEEFGFYANSQSSFTCEGADGMERMKGIMDGFRKDIPEAIAGLKVVSFSDYQASFTLNTESGEKSEISLPKSNVISMKLENGSSLFLRPSGTEPKIKLYIESIADNAEASTKQSEEIKADMSKKMGF